MAAAPGPWTAGYQPGSPMPTSHAATRVANRRRQPDAGLRSPHFRTLRNSLITLSGITTMSIKPQVLDLISLVESGQMLEAITKYYDENIAMQENVSPPTVGFAENYAREAAFYGSLKALKFNLISVVVEGDRAAINWVFDYTTA